MKKNKVIAVGIAIVSLLGFLYPALLNLETAHPVRAIFFFCLFLGGVVAIITIGSSDSHEGH